MSTRWVADPANERWVGPGGATQAWAGSSGPNYPGQPETLLWGEGIRQETGTWRPGVPVVRLFGNPGNWGVGGLMDGYLDDCRTEGIVPFLSNKVTGTDWANAASGGDDANLNLTLDRIEDHVDAGGLEVLFSLHHEPDGAGGDDPAGYSAHLAMNEHFRDLITSRGLTDYVSLGPTFTGWMGRTEFLDGGARDPRLWVPSSHPYDWIGADLYSADDSAPSIEGSVLDYGGVGNDVNGVSQIGNADRWLSFARLRGLDLHVPEWGVWGKDNDDRVDEFYDWCAANPDIKTLCYYNRVGTDGGFMFGNQGRPDAREDRWLDYFNGVLP